MDEPALRAEATALHLALFGRDAPDEIARRYVDAHAHALTRVTPEERAWMARAVESDLEALEIALRGRAPNHVLSRKMRLLVYLCEASPDYFALFVNQEPRRWRALLALGWHVLRTRLKSFKGWILLRALGR